jgi:hypothetical protein
LFSVLLVEEGPEDWRHDCDRPCSEDLFDPLLLDYFYELGNCPFRLGDLKFGFLVGECED